MSTGHNSFAQLEISRRNIVHNLNYFRSKLKPETKLLVLMKANAYGHGSVCVAKEVEKLGVDYFAVAHAVEGVTMRQGGIVKTPIIVLTAGVDYFQEMTDNNLEPAIPTVEALDLFDKHLEKNGIEMYPVHIKLDTGMHRLGFVESEIPALLDYLKTHPRIIVKSIYTHLSVADTPGEEEYTLNQIKLYTRMAPQIDAVIAERNPSDPKPIHHVLNSAGIERFTEYQMDMVRLGIGFYGISHIDQKFVKPIGTLKCKILQIKHLQPGGGDVGYGRWGKITKPTVTATLPLGYADGLNRHLGRGKATFLLNGKRVPTIGNICMDSCMIDITGIDAKVGDVVTIFGEEPSTIELAKILDTIPYEIITPVNVRVERVVVD